MYADLHFAFEMHKARQDDLLRQAEEHRLGKRSRKTCAYLLPVVTHQASPGLCLTERMK